MSPASLPPSASRRMSSFCKRRSCELHGCALVSLLKAGCARHYGIPYIVTVQCSNKWRLSKRAVDAAEERRGVGGYSNLVHHSAVNSNSCPRSLLRLQGSALREIAWHMGSSQLEGSVLGTAVQHPDF